MKYAESGEKSIAWWITQVELYGGDSYRGIMRGANVPVHQIRPAIADLESKGYVYAEGEGGRGRVQRFYVSQSGRRYLDSNNEELSELPEIPTPADVTPEPPRPPEPEEEHRIEYSKKIKDGRPVYYADDNVVHGIQVPALTRARLDSETPNPVKATERDTASAVKPGQHHSVPVIKLRDDLPPEPSEKGGKPVLIRSDRRAAHAKPPTPRTPIDDVTLVDEAIEQEAERMNKDQGTTGKPGVAAKQRVKDFTLTRDQFNHLFKDALIAILLARYAEKVTAAEVMEVINGEWDGMIEEAKGE